MRGWQKGIVAVLLFLIVALSAVAIYLSFPALIGQAGNTQIRVGAVSTTISAAPILTSVPSLTPFQPSDVTPTASPVPTITPTPSPTPVPTHTFTPIPSYTVTPLVPEQVYIGGIYGYPQAFNLSCESRSASDLARYFGVHFTELEFLYALPASDNPDKGFVGNVRGSLGQLPPLGYGVHAGPVSALLREFGLETQASVGLKFLDLQKELAAGRPVLVWAISNLGISKPIEQTYEDGSTSKVARFEHTFILLGYTNRSVTVLDNEKIYSVPIAQFLDSWGVLENMAITVDAVPGGE